MKKTFFSNLPEQCELLKNQIEGETFTKIYSELNFLYFQFPVLNQAISEDEKNAVFDNIKSKLSKFLSSFRFFTFYITNINDPTKGLLTNLKSNNDKDYLQLNPKSYTQSVNVIISSEKNCLIIENIPTSFFLSIIKTLEKIEISTISVTSDDPTEIQTKYEITSFCDHFRSFIINNKFVQLTIPSISCYLIRRFFYPTCFFKDPSFFKQDEHEMKTNFHSILSQKITVELLFTTVIKKFASIMKEFDEKEHETINNQDFHEEEFIKLRKINGNRERIIYLVIHIKSLRLYIMKITYSGEQREINFCKNHSHRCCRKFYGFLTKGTQRIGFIYEFMSNGTLEDFIKEQQIDSAYILMTIIRLFQGIDYLHSNLLIHRDLKPSNILIDNDYIPYISDFDVIRKLDNKSMTYDIGSPLYTSPEQYDGRNISYSTDIYSFGLIIYFLFEKKHLLSFWNKESKQIPMISNASKNIQDICQACIQYDPEKRMKRDEIKSKILDEINQLSYLEFYFTHYTDKMFILDKTSLIVQYFFEGIFIQINNEDTLNKYLIRLYSFCPLLIFKQDGRYNDLYAVLGEYYSQGRIVKKDLLKAIEYYKLAANLGDSYALLFLGIHYEDGSGVKQDYLKAKKYYERSAKLKNSNGFLNLGLLYEKGRGVKQDYEKAKKYYELSAELGNSKACFNLGRMYEIGKGFQQDYLKAKKLYELSAKLNNPNAFYNLGRLYCIGLGVEQDYLKAKKFFELAAIRKNLEAFLELGIFYEKGYGVKQDYLKAKEYYEHCAKQNNPNALYYLGNLYYKGLGVEKDVEKAIHYFELSAKGNYIDAFIMLGSLFEEGNDVKQDLQKAQEYFELAVKEGNSSTIFKLGYMFQQGINVDKDHLKAKKYYELAAKQNNSFALLNLGTLYFEGIGIEKDYLKGKEYFEKSAKLNNSTALVNLGNIYCMGLGVEKSYLKAKEYYEKAAKQGNSRALFNLGLIYDYGQGIMRDHLKANEYYTLAAIKGYANAFLQLGCQYENGVGVQQNYSKAKEYYEVAAKQNNPNAFLQLGNLYSSGHGVEQDYSKAIEFYELSAKQNNTKALINLGYLYEKGLGVKQDISKALDYYGKSAKLGDSNGYLNIGFLKAQNHQYSEAITYYELSAKQNNPTALLNLGALYELGQGVKQNYSKAKEYYELSAQHNESSAFLYLGTLYENGNGVKQDYLKAKEYYELAALQNNSNAIAYLGSLYEKGLGVDQKVLIAKDFYEISAKQNNAIALFNLGILFSNDEYFDINLKKAEDYFLRCFNTQCNEVVTYSHKEGAFFVSSLYNIYRYRSLNDLGLLYLTLSRDNEKAFEYLKEPAFAEYPFAQNNLGLYYQLFLNDMRNAEHMFERSSENFFALAEFNLACMKEKENQMQEAIEYLIKASEHEDQPLLYKNFHHYDKRLEISKKFILCFTNLKLSLHFLKESNFDESRKYFVKSFAKLNDKTYRFEFHLNKEMAKNMFSYLKKYIIHYPPFNFKNQPYENIKKYISDLHLDNDDPKEENKHNQTLMNTDFQFDDIEMQQILKYNLMNELGLIYESNDFNEGESNEPWNDYRDDYEQNEVIFDDPGKLFDYIVKKDELQNSFVGEVNEILIIMEKILFTPPYPILFGRISIKKPKQKRIVSYYPFIKDINELFYEGLGII